MGGLTGKITTVKGTACAKVLEEGETLCVQLVKGHGRKLLGNVPKAEYAPSNRNWHMCSPKGTHKKPAWEGEAEGS
jgi:hypothetical protein